MYSSINAVLEKIERQALKAKERKITKKRNTSGNSGRPLGIIEPSHVNPEQPRIIRSESYAAKPMTVEEAVLEVTGSKSDFLVFAMPNRTGSVLFIGGKTGILV